MDDEVDEEAVKEQIAVMTVEELCATVCECQRRLKQLTEQDTEGEQWNRGCK